MPESGDVDVLRPRNLSSGLSDRRRLGRSLKLDFSAIGSTDDYPVPKKCKVESMNFCSAYNGNYNVSSSPTPARTMLPQDLASKLNKSKQILILDCRPFMSYNTNHIQGAVNINCSDRFNRKRLQQGKVSLVDLVTTKEGKDLFKRRLTKEIILYDDQTSELHQIATETSMHLVLATLLREGKETFVLKGGLTDFCAAHRELCDTHIKSKEQRPIYSPTTSVIEPEIETATASQILPFLFLGNERDAANYQRLHDLNISYILNATSHIPCHFDNMGIKYRRIQASDNWQQNLRQFFDEALEFIDEARQKKANILIHCQAGVSRSATITIAYILAHTLMSMSDAYKYVKGKRTIISPNFNFMGQLMEYEQELNQGTVTRQLQPTLIEVDSFV
ncbi:hypothetical protein ScPMuIL_014702 [Solemya velum]